AESASRPGALPAFPTRRSSDLEFRALEQRVIERLLREGPRIVSTGGGAFMNAQTRVAIADHGISVWLKADLDLLMERVAKKQNRDRKSTRLNSSHVKSSYAVFG